ncbi:hypothetical protein B296_00036293 [Ensete ventricosum]|uniref:Uncharacterized protein n=1 Tax=Ensete ventricosum TaxID=4639 RepID=A0A426ZEY2_ENSVE|nr:hypothetical protein B296_00036293 [Ensete ventricosum]
MKDLIVRRPSAVSQAKHRELFPTALFRIQQPTTNGTVHEEEEEGQSGASNRRRRPFRLENNAPSALLSLSLSLRDETSFEPIKGLASRGVPGCVRRSGQTKGSWSSRNRIAFALEQPFRCPWFFFPNSDAVALHAMLLPHSHHCRRGGVESTST